MLVQSGWLIMSKQVSDLLCILKITFKKRSINIASVCNMWVVVCGLLALRDFFSKFSSFPLSSKTDIFKFQFDLDPKATGFSVTKLSTLVKQSFHVLLTQQEVLMEMKHWKSTVCSRSTSRRVLHMAKLPLVRCRNS